MNEQKPNQEADTGNLEDTIVPVSPDQTSILDEAPGTLRSSELPEAVTRLDIPHVTLVERKQDTTNEQPAVVDQTSSMTQAAVTQSIEVTAPVEEVPAATEATPEEEVSSGTKIKIISALAIVGIAGYVAYWVQEPLQIKSDVLSSSTTNEAATVTPAETKTDATTVAADDAANTSLAADTTAAATPDNIATTGPSVNVDVSLFGFEPATLAIDKGTMIIWTNTSTEDQTIIGSSANGQSFASPVLTSGQNFNYKFEDDGKFEYYSTYNPALKATITVGTGTPAITTPPVTASDATNSTNAGVGAVADENLSPAAPAKESATAGVLTDAIDETMSTQKQKDALVTQENSKTDLEEMKPAADIPKKLSKTGPAETLYAGILLGLAWLNRKKLQKAFRSNR